MPPIYDVRTRRPFYDADMIEQNLQARHRNCGVNGKPLMFYAARPSSTILRRSGNGKSRKSVQKPSVSRHVGLIESLKSLGLQGVNDEQVEAALQAGFPDDLGVSEDEGTRLRAVYRHLRCSYAAENSAHNLWA